MKWLAEHTSQIEALLRQRTPQTLTYAALRCRMALELVCYDRLRIAHDYISAEDLRRWQPRDIVSRLIQDVDPRIASSYTFSISKDSLADETREFTQSDYKGLEYVEVGRQVGFDADRLGKIWNSLGSFLHVRVPKSSEAELTTFGKVEDIQQKVEEALVMLKELERGTVMTSGWGRTIHFDCNCGAKNKRRADLVRHGQIVSCINPGCVERWTVSIEGNDIWFQWRTISIPCYKCSQKNHIPEQTLQQLKRNQQCRFACEACNVENLVMWRLMYLHSAKEH